MSKKKVSRREQILVIAACLTLAGMGYFALRYYPASKAIAKLKQETAEALDKQKGMDLPNAPDADLAALKKEEQAMAAALAGARAAIADLERQFAPADAPEILNEVEVEIIELARENGMEVLENVPLGPKAAPPPKTPTPPITDLPGGSQAAPAKTGGEALAGAAASGGPSPPDGVAYLHGRPWRRFTIATSYHGLKSFVRGLDRLSWRVTLVQWDIEAIDMGESGTYDWPLVVTVVLAL